MRVKSTVVCVTVPTQLLKEVDAWAKQRMISRSELFRYLLMEKLGERKEAKTN